jgi:predicted  nucleic acid-binding Zn-ribbon protein
MKYQYTTDDITKLEQVISKDECKIDELNNECLSLKAQIEDATRMSASLKDEIDLVTESKLGLEKELKESEQKVSELQKNLTNSQQQLKKEVFLFAKNNEWLFSSNINKNQRFR